MTSIEPTRPQLSVRDVLALSDADLTQYMEQNRRSDGNFVPDIADWDTLPKDQREALAGRLKFGARKAGEAVRSRSVDLDQVNARLLKAATDDASPRVMPVPRRRERSPLRPLAELRAIERCLEREVEKGHYNALVNDGGRPYYPIALLEDVSENPLKYRTMVQPWQDNKRMLVVEEDTEELAALEADPLHLMPLWKVRERQRNRGYPYLRWVEKPKHTGAEEGDSGGQAAPDADHYDVFSVYAEKVKRRLAIHGFTRTFQLDKDPKRQDKLTTWIEYLNYEYSWYDRYAQYIKRLQPQHDEDWKKLVDSGVLRPSETEEYLLTDESSIERGSEWSAARRALESAKAAAYAAVAETEKAKNGRSRLSTTERKRGLARAHPNYLAAEETWKSTKRRGDLITGFIRGIRDYRITKDDVHRQGILLQWILKQVPLVEAELNESKAAEYSEPGIADASATKRIANTASSTRLANDASRKTRGGRITKNAPQRQGGSSQAPGPDTLSRQVQKPRHLIEDAAHPTSMCLGTLATQDSTQTPQETAQHK
ncbi:hypothetical protein MFIFM68171_02406 [Madurella fahalii]|uniref:Uncharacterized protein n=1 Tax=Madurella fahalii TaxID=1157608 RepID=A0ABQ0G368_9PEZI